MCRVGLTTWPAPAVVVDPMKLSHWFSASATSALMGALLLGCTADRGHVAAPSSVPPAHIDLRACSLDVEGTTNPGGVMDTMGKAIEDSMAGRSTGNVKPARFNAKVQTTSSTSVAGVTGSVLTLPLLPFLTFMWFPLGYVTANVDLDMEVEGMHVLGKGTSTQTIYWTGNSTDTYLLAAVFNATQDALHNATAKQAAALRILQLGSVQ